MKTQLSYLSAILLLCTAAATAQTICIPLAKGVPGALYNRAPNWWDSDLGEPFYNANIDAPTWRGAFGLGYPKGAATSEALHFRALHRDDAGKEYVYLSWYGKVVSDLNILDNNKLIVGFSNGGAGDPAFALTITPNVTSEVIATQNYTLQVSINTGGGWSPYVGPPPTWLKGTATPATDGTTRIWIIRSLTNQWAVNMRIPVSTAATATDITDGIPIDPSSFRMWYEFRTGTPEVEDIPSTPEDESMPAGFAPYKFPRTIADADPLTNAPPPIDPPSPAIGWATLHLKTDTTPTDLCSIEGVGITNVDIGTQNPDGTPNADQRAISLLQPNTFFARPKNHGTMTTANNIRARFRIANWGTGLTWEDVCPEADEECSPNTELWVDIGPSGGVPLGGTSIDPDSSTNIQLPYAISGPTSFCERCRYESYYAAHITDCDDDCDDETNNKKLDHQCMLVELTGDADFLNDSVYANMNFVNVSTFTEAAEVNLNGRPVRSAEHELASGVLDGNLPRNVYFYIESYNMPERKPGGSGSQPPPPLKPDLFMPSWPCHPAFDVNRPKDQRRKELQLLLQSGQLTFENVAHNVPTYIVHAYYDSGIRNTAGGSSRAVLRPMQSFGYFVMHDGQPAGWMTDLQGAQQVGPNWYRIAIPESGVARIHPMIQAIDSPAPTLPRYRLFVDAGLNFPQGSFGDGIDGQLSINAGLERFVAANTSIEAILGYHAFDSDFGSNPRIWQLSANVKQYFGEGRLRYFVNGGVGAYRFEPGSTTRAGANVGSGVLYDLPSVWDVEGVYNFHVINTSDSRTRFSTLQIGIRRSL